jgi:DNA polymerase-3 subunit delta
MIYFLYGEDSYRAKRKLDEISESYKKVHKSGLNLVWLDVEKQGYKDFVNNFRTTSMFAEKKLVILKNLFSAKGGPASGWQEDFLGDFKKLNEAKDIIIIYEADKVDERTKFFKTLAKEAKCQEFNFLQPAQLRKWVQAEFANYGAKINPDAENLLLSFVGNNLWQLGNEIKKLANYKKGGLVKREDVKLQVRPKIENDIFKTIDALASKNKKEALFLLHKHLDGGDNALYLLSMIAYQFRNLLTIKELMDAKKPLAKCGLHPFVIRKSSYLCNQFSMEQLKKIYQKIFQVDLDIKTGKIEPETALDLLVLEI